MAKKETVKKEEFNYNFGIVKIDIIGFELLPPGNEDIILEKLVHEVGFDHNMDADEDLFSIAPFVRIITPEKKEILSRLMIACTFRIPGLKEHNKKIGEADGLPIAIVEILASVSISTMRGVLYSQLKGTYLNDAILPVVDPKRVVQASMAQNEENK